MIIQYPHILRLFGLASTPVLVDGEWVFTENEEPVEYDCRAEESSQGRSIKTTTGELVAYSFTIYMKPISDTLEYGATVQLIISENEKYDLKVLRQTNNQLNTKIWL